MRNKIISQVIIHPDFISVLSVWLLGNWWKEIDSKIYGDLRYTIRTLVTHEILDRTILHDGHRFQG